MPTGIQWTEETWNPIAGCSMVSPGCTNCYAMLQAHRNAAMGLEKYKGLTTISGGRPVWNGEINFDEKALLKPLNKKKPTIYFVNSMSDLFHQGVTDEEIARVFTVMMLCPQHIFQVLTKRPERAKNFLRSEDIPVRIDGIPMEIWKAWRATRQEKHVWPLPNVWLGTSCENQAAADARIPQLLQAPAAIRFISAEPLLGPITFRWSSWDRASDRPTVDHLDGLRRLNWVIIGGESGPGARPCFLEWVHEMVAQCAEAEVACFVKQMGAVPMIGNGIKLKLKDRKGGDPEEWPEQLRVRQMPEGIPYESLHRIEE